MLTLLHGIYFAAAGALLLYGFNCYYLILLLRGRARNRNPGPPPSATAPDDDRDWPMVVTQLPVYNEADVAERVMRAAAAIDYPAGRHHIQVLDDSTDETRALIDRVAADLRRRCVSIDVVRRPDRRGYKAGALAHGMTLTKADFFAIFDADFLPPPDFLKRIMPAFDDPRLGLAQARWDHLNAGDSLLTFAQSMGIDGHFTIEQAARARGGLFMNFNGTAGIWRRRAIEDGGGWSADTLTEDMDLSYRSQMAGWKPRFFSGVAVPAELPATASGFKSQQFRWAKGSMQTARKILPRLLRAPEVKARVKWQAFMHLTHYLIHPLILVLALLALPVLYTLPLQLPPWAFAVVATCLLMGMSGPSALYVTSQRRLHRDWRRRLVHLPVLMTVGVGLALSNTRAVIEGLFGRCGGEFVRTPKKGERTRSRYRVGCGMHPGFELMLGSYCAASLIIYLQQQNYLIGPFLLIYTIGFLSMAVRGLAELRPARARRVPDPVSGRAPAGDDGRDAALPARSR